MVIIYTPVHLPHDLADLVPSNKEALITKMFRILIIVTTATV